MEPYSAGFLSLLPPVLAVILALKTKEVYSSLIFGILCGALLYCSQSGGNPLIRPAEVTLEILSAKFDLKIAIFCALLGALISVINASGGIREYGKWARKKLQTRRKALFSTMFLGILIFIDDYFNCLTVGTVMKPVTDAQKISREKLAFIIDSTAAPICIIAPISSWAVAVSSNLTTKAAEETPFMIFLSCIPWNFYAVFCLCFVLLIIALDFDFGPMRRAELTHQEKLAKGEEEVHAPVPAECEVKSKPSGTIGDILIPIGFLITATVLAMLSTGGFWKEGDAFHEVALAMGNSDPSFSLILGALAGLLAAFFKYIPRRISTMADFMKNAVKGAQNMLPAIIILMLAWTLSGITRELLEAPKFIASLVSADNGLAVSLLPALAFMLAGFLSFSIGTAWGTFGILIPIIISIFEAVFPGNPADLYIMLAATLAGSVFGDHCSPISDTTILSSAGAGCDHVSHVSTQLPYCMFIAGASLLGYVTAGFTRSLFLSLTVSLAALIGGLLFIRRRARGNHPAETAETA